MKLLAQAITAFLFCAAVLLAVQLLRHARPPRPIRGGGVGACVVLVARGDAPGLESAVRALADFPCVLIADCGLSGDARRLAAILQRDSAQVLLVTPEEIPGLLEVTEWT